MRQSYVSLFGIIALLSSLGMATNGGAGTSEREAGVDWKLVESAVREMKPQEGHWMLQEWTPTGRYARAVWVRGGLNDPEWQEARTGKAIGIRFFMGTSEDEAMSRLRHSVEDVQVGPNGKCLEISENCLIWRVELKNATPVTLKFTNGAIWIEVTARTEEAGMAFAREIRLQLERKAQAPK